MRNNDLLSTSDAKSHLWKGHVLYEKLIRQKLGCLFKKMPHLQPAKCPIHLCVEMIAGYCANVISRTQTQ